MWTIQRLLGARRISALSGLTAAARRAGQELYLTGGFLRDRLAGIRPKAEIDLASVNPGGLIAGTGNLSGATAFLLDRERDTWRIAVSPGSALEQIDITRLRGSSIAEDLRERDFTVNALAVEISSGGGPAELIDPSGGLTDLQRGVLRVCSATSFADDPLRVLRGIRLASTHSFRLEKTTLALAKKAAGKLAAVSGERIRQELFAILQGPDPRGGLSAIVRHSLLAHVSRAFRGTGALSLPLVGRTSALLGEFDGRSRVMRKIDARMEQDVTGRGTLLLSAFLRDRGAAAGVRDISRRLLLGKKSAGALQALVTADLPARWLLKPASARRSDLYEVHRAGNGFVEEILLLEAAATMPVRIRKKNTVQLLTSYGRARALFQAPPLLSGRNAMKHFGLSPGAELGSLLHRAKEAQDLGHFSDFTGALSWARRYLATGEGD